MTNQPTGAASRKARATSLIKSTDNKAARLPAEAPSTLRMPISSTR
jgi:hypothetical protein